LVARGGFEPPTFGL